MRPSAPAQQACAPGRPPRRVGGRRPRRAPTRFAPWRLAQASLVLALAAACAGRDAGPATPHVVIFLVDTLRADRLPVYGYERPTSPHLEALARSGVVFEHAHAPAPWTLPSVVSLFTSRFLPEHGVARDGQRLSRALPTLTERLQQEGYATHAFVMNPYVGQASGLDRGFARLELLGRGQDVEPVEDFLDDVSTEEPLFLYVHTTEPHDPFIVPERYVRPFGEVSSEQRGRIAHAYARYRDLTRVDFANGRPPGATDNGAQQRVFMGVLERLREPLEVLYAASVLQADEGVGRVVRALQRRGMWDDTLFVFLSDHGEEMGEHDGWQHDQSLYEELVRVPLIVRLPGDAHGGERVAQPVSLLDVAPTVLAVVGIEEGLPEARGNHLLALLTEESTSPRRVTAVRDNRKKHYRPFQETRGDRNVAVRQGRWKAIWNVEPDTLELYDVAEDPGETRDRSDDRPALAEALAEHARRSFARYQEEGDPPERSRIGADERRLLEELGYVVGPLEDAEPAEPSIREETGGGGAFRAGRSGGPADRP